MVKLIFSIFIFSLIGVITAPEFLMADHILAKSPGADAVLTVEPEPEPEPVVESTVSYTAPVNTAPVNTAPAMANYQVSYYIGSAAEYEATALNLSYNGLYKYNKMIYGHNSYNLLGNLSNRYVGETITITEGGVARQYQVTAVQTYQKTAEGFLNGDAKLMGRIANTALGYDVALFTCAGVSYGNGDASHRLVVFANAQ